jgi:hypothetical protein
MLSLTVVLLALGAPVDDSATPARADEEVEVLLRRVEATELRFNGNLDRRIATDDEGNVIHLLLDNMQFTTQEFRALGRIEHLQRISFRRTNVSVGDLRELRGLKELVMLNLCSTELTDDAIAELVLLPALRTICMGDVPISPEAVELLKKEFDAQDRKLSLGYSQRK